MDKYHELVVHPMFKVKAVFEEGNCLKTQQHSLSCNSRSHSCYRCGMYLGRCDCATLGSPLDY